MNSYEEKLANIDYYIYDHEYEELKGATLKPRVAATEPGKIHHSA